MNVFICVFMAWLIGAIFSIAFVKSANKKEDERY